MKKLAILFVTSLIAVVIGCSGNKTVAKKFTIAVIPKGRKSRVG